MALRKTERDIELALKGCKSAYTKLLEVLNETTAENEIEWIRRTQTRYNETIETIQSFTAMTENRNTARQNCVLRMEKAKMPSFNGTISHKRAIEHDTTELRLTTTSTIKGSAHYAKTNKDSVERQEDSTLPPPPP